MGWGEREREEGLGRLAPRGRPPPSVPLLPTHVFRMCSSLSLPMAVQGEIEPLRKPRHESGRPGSGDERLRAIHKTRSAPARLVYSSEASKLELDRLKRQQETAMRTPSDNNDSPISPDQSPVQCVCFLHIPSPCTISHFRWKQAPKPSVSRPGPASDEHVLLLCRRSPRRPTRMQSLTLEIGSCSDSAHSEFLQNSWRGEILENFLFLGDRVTASDTDRLQALGVT